MEGINRVTNRQTLAGAFTPSTPANVHSHGGDIATINGTLLCKPKVGSFMLTCDRIDVADDLLSAQCLKRNGIRVPATLTLTGYRGVISNCDGVLFKGRC